MSGVRRCNNKGKKKASAEPIDSTLGHFKELGSSAGYGRKGQPLRVGQRSTWKAERGSTHIPTDNDIEHNQYEKTDEASLV